RCFDVFCDLLSSHGPVVFVYSTSLSYALCYPADTALHSFPTRRSSDLDLECRWSKVLTFGDKIVMAGHFYNGQNRPCYFGAAYEFLTDDHTCEGMIGLRAASEVEFEDDGHAIAWAMQQ